MLTTSAPSPLAVLDAACAVLAVRGAYRAASAEGEPATAAEVTGYLYRPATLTSEDRRRLELAAYPLQEPACVLAWMRAGAGHREPNRRHLARLAAAEQVTPDDVAALVAAVIEWDAEQQPDGISRHIAPRRRPRSRPQGRTGQHIARTGTVVAVVAQTARDEATGHRLIKVRDAEGNAYAWAATGTPLPEKGARLRIDGRVCARSVRHGEWLTYLAGCHWEALPDQD